MMASLSAGYSGSMGTYAPPALSTAIMAIIISRDRSSITPTGCSSFTPLASRNLASWLARWSSSLYVSHLPCRCAVCHQSLNAEWKYALYAWQLLELMEAEAPHGPRSAVACKERETGLASPN